MTLTIFEELALEVRDGLDPIEGARRLLAIMSDSELIATLHGDMPFWECIHQADFGGYNINPYVAGRNDRLGIPGIRFADGPRGVVVQHSTCFPVALARGASWDTDLEFQIGRRIGQEARAQGANLFAGVCINLVRHPGWGRSQESYGEDPVHVGAMGAATVRGVRESVMSCVKHFAVNSIETVRHVVDVECPDDVMHEIYLPHFRQVVEAGTDAVMTAYNSINGEWASQSRWLLTDVLRDLWEFDGFVMSDFFQGFRDSVATIEAGMDLEMPCAQQHPRNLPDALRSGRLQRSDLELSAARIVAAQLTTYHLWSREDPSVVPADSVGLALAHRSAVRSAVLLRNTEVDGHPLLPVEASQLRRVLVVGALADTPVTGDHGSSDVRAPHVVTLLEGLRSALPGVEVVHEPTDAGRVAVLAAGVDLVVAYLSYSDTDQGEHYDMHQSGLLESLAPPPSNALEERLRNEVRENLATKLMPLTDPTSGVLPTSDRYDLGLPAIDVALLEAALEVNSRTVAVVATGNAVTMPWANRVPAVLVQWFAGAEGGRATADLLVGNEVPSGRLPMSFPGEATTLPYFDVTAETAQYDQWFGYRLNDRSAERPAFPMGFGLTYGSLSWSAPNVVTETEEGWRVGLRIENRTSRDLAEVVQIYGGPRDPRRDRPARVLLGFARVEVSAYATQDVEVVARRAALGQWDGAEVVPFHGPVRLEVSRFHGDPDAALLYVS